MKFSGNKEIPIVLFKDGQCDGKCYLSAKIYYAFELNKIKQLYCWKIFLGKYRDVMKIEGYSGNKVDQNLAYPTSTELVQFLESFQVLNITLLVVSSSHPTVKEEF